MGKMQFVWSGETELPAGWALQPHCHDFFHLAYVHRGQLVFRADKLDYPLAEGSLILLPPGVVHAVPEDAHNLCTQYEVMFRILDPELQLLLDTKKVLVLHGASHLEPLFSYICMHYKSVDPLCISCVDAFLCTILFSFLTGKPSSAEESAGYVDTSGYSALVRRILCHVEKDSDRKYDLSSLAQSLGFNKTYLCTAFRRETGITISEYFNYHRIRETLITLQYNGYSKDFPICELADQFGYANASYFNRVFKRYTGMTPTEFMNALSRGTDSPEQSAFQKYYNEYLDLKRYPIKESLRYMRGLKAAAEEIL
ncbi:MAG: AraC family transcriptional regulator [Oscillospiraceae bacterium]|nr:AraC family transcriptional regulator [Oscillospiraceae bacterium]